MAYCNVSQRRMVVEERDAAIEWGTRALAARGTPRTTPRRGSTRSPTSAAPRSRTDSTMGGRRYWRALELAQLHRARRSRREDLQRARDVVDTRSGHSHRSMAISRTVSRTARSVVSTRWRLYLVGVPRLVRSSSAANGTRRLIRRRVVLRDPRSHRWPRSWALAALGLIRARRGDAEALAPLVEAHELGETTGELTRIGPAAAALGETAMAGRRERRRRER